MAKVPDTNPRVTTPTDKGLRPRVQQHRIEQWQADWAEIRRLANDLHNAAEPILAAADQTTTDPYPASVRGQEGRGAGDHPDPTLTYLENVGGGEHDDNNPEHDTPDTWEEPDDLVAQWIRELRLITYEARGIVRRSARLKDMILKRNDPRVIDTGGSCAACTRYVTGHGTDRLRAGYCSACYQAWLRWRTDKPDPSHHVFVNWRRDQLADSA